MAHSLPFETRHADTPLGRLAYFDEGSGEALVFVHGLVGTRTHFGHVAPAFTDTHRVIGLDLPGCGSSHKPTSRVSIRLYADTLLGFMRGLGVERATLIGHSAGGQVVASAALIAPERVDRLVLMNSAGLRHFSLVARMTGRAVMRPWIVSRVLGPSSSWILRRIFHQKKNKFVEQFVEESTSPGRDPQFRAAALRDMGKVFHDLAPDLMTASVMHAAAQLWMPTLIIWGDRDRLVPLGDVRGVTQRFPNARLEVITNCGHMPMIEEPDATIALMRDFLNGPIPSRPL